MEWFKKSELKSDNEELKLVNKALKKETQQLKEQVFELKQKKKMEEENIKHLVKIDRERKDIELEKEKIKLTGEASDKIARVKDEYRDKTEAQLEKQLTNMQTMYSEILTRLPNYNVQHKIKEG